MIFDLHNDIITCVGARRFRRYVKKAQKQSVEGILCSVWTTKMGEPFAQIRRARKIIDETKTDVKLLLHVEDAWFLDLNNVEEFLELKPYSVGLTWNYDNTLAGGAKGTGHLTPLGEKIIEKLIAGGVQIDLAHLNRESFFQVAACVGGALLCTHTCFDEVTPHPRNLTREQVELIVKSGGVVGLTFEKSFCNGDVMKHFLWFKNNFGINNLGIGTDFFGATVPKELKNYKRVRQFFRGLLYDV